GWDPLCIAIGLGTIKLDEHGQKRRNTRGQLLIECKYTLHDTRHYYASMLINRKKDGGAELPIQIVSYRMGHKNVSTTWNLYGHLFPQADGSVGMSELEMVMHQVDWANQTTDFDQTGKTAG